MSPAPEPVAPGSGRSSAGAASPGASPPWRSPASYLHEAEAVADFERLGAALRAELAPADAIEELWCDDIVS